MNIRTQYLSKKQKNGLGAPGIALDRTSGMKQHNGANKSQMIAQGAGRTDASS